MSHFCFSATGAPWMSRIRSSSGSRGRLTWLLVAAAVMTAASGCHEGQARAQLPSDEVANDQGDHAARVETAQVTAGPVARPVRASGSTEPSRAANLTPEMTATILEIYVEEGSRVEEGQPLARLNSRVARLQASQAQAQAAAAQAQAQQLSRDHERYSSLATAGALAASKVQQLGAQRDVVRSQQQAAEAAVKLARHAASNGILRAPFAGIVSSVQMEEGELVTMMPPRVLLRLVDLSRVDVRVRAPEAQMTRIQMGDPAQATIAGNTYRGEVTHVGVEVHPLTRTGEVMASFDNSDGSLLAGMFAQLEIEPRGDRRALVVPSSAVAREGGKRHVFVVDPSCRARSREVEVERAGPGRLEVRSGIEEGERIVITGVARLADGTVLTTDGCNGAEPGSEARP